MPKSYQEIDWNLISKSLYSTIHICPADYLSGQICQISVFVLKEIMSQKLKVIIGGDVILLSCQEGFIKAQWSAGQLNCW